MKRSEYRRYKIRTVKGPDDFATMTEVVGRRLDRLTAENRPLPDLLLVDGGKGQLGAAMEAAAACGLLGQIELAGIAKGRPRAPDPRDRFDRIFRPGDSEPIDFGSDPSSLALLQMIRDEAHRFAITFHQDRQRKQSLKSILDEIPGVGRVRRRQLLRTFRTISRIRGATAEELTGIPGINRKTARSIVEFLRQHSTSEAPTPGSIPEDR